MYATSHKRPFVPSVGGIGLLYIGTGPSQFCETSAKINDWVTDPLRWFCNILWLEGGNFDSPKIIDSKMGNWMLISMIS